MKKLRIAAIGDIHVRETSSGAYQALFTEISNKADVLVLCGDLTDHGLPHEAEILAHELEACKVPIVGVLGNHDYDSDQAGKVKHILASRMRVLEDEPFELNEVGFAGVKGFCGGFGNRMLASFGEHAIKSFVQEAVNEALLLEHALTQLKTEKKVVVLHYSPIAETLVGEPPEIFPFLGSSRLLDPIERFGASAVFHGHADLGTLKAATPKGIPVYNVALPLLRRLSPTQLYALVEV